MSRITKYTDEFVAFTYKRIVQNLLLYNRPMYAEALAEKLGIKVAELRRVLHLKRISWDFSKDPITQYVISTPEGYALPSFGNEILAFCLQYLGTVKSISRWLIPVNDYLKEHYPEEYDKAVEAKAEANYDDMDEYDPWAVFKQLA